MSSIKVQGRKKEGEENERLEKRGGREEAKSYPHFSEEKTNGS